MFRLTIRRWSERTGMLGLMLAVLLPAAALMVASVLHLKSIQREKAVEAVQRDYQQVLAIAEKRIVDHAYEITEDIKTSFDINHPDKLNGFVAAQPDVAHAFWGDRATLHLYLGLIPKPVGRPCRASRQRGVASLVRLVAGQDLNRLQQIQSLLKAKRCIPLASTDGAKPSVGMREELVWEPLSSETETERLALINVAGRRSPVAV